MSLGLQITVTENKNSFLVQECTGNYSSNNKSGYGVYNPLIKDVTSATLEVTNPDGDTYTINVYPYLPNTDSTGFEVTPNRVGYSDGVLKTGVYKIKYIVSGTYKGSNFEYFVVNKEVFTRQVECCVDKWMKKIDKNAYKDKKQQDIIMMNNMLESLCYQIDCGLYDLALETIESLNAQCGCCDC